MEPVVQVEFYSTDDSEICEVKLKIEVSRLWLGTGRITGGIIRTLWQQSPIK